MSQRFTDAELAAEYWRAELDVATDGYSLNEEGCDWEIFSDPIIQQRQKTLHRFATLPHAHPQPNKPKPIPHRHRTK